MTDLSGSGAERWKYIHFTQRSFLTPTLQICPWVF